jgi:glycolate oxidase FAD binding subunit
MLALDPPEPEATLGGIVSANASGPRRLRFGTARDLLIGITIVLPDGNVASAGGRVVKNVAGYDLGKLFIGAHGSLGVVVSTTWRLHPLPAARAVVRLGLGDCREATTLARTLAHSGLTPTAIELRGRAGSTGEMQVLFESIPESVASQAEAAVALLGRGEVLDSLPPDFGQRPVGDDTVSVRIGYPPKALSGALAALPPGTAVRASARAGILEAVLAAPDADIAMTLERLRDQLRPLTSHAVVFATPPRLRNVIDHWGPIGSTLPLMRRVKDEFDPEHRFSPARFVGAI